jgi:hypothetical protein
LFAPRTFATPQSDSTRALGGTSQRSITPTLACFSLRSFCAQGKEVEMTASAPSQSKAPAAEAAAEFKPKKAPRKL